MQSTNTNPALAAAFDHALATARIDQNSLRWVGRWDIAITIDGVERSKRVAVMTASGVRETLADLLNEHCVEAAVRAVGGLR